MDKHPGPEALLESLSRGLSHHMILPRDFAEKLLRHYYGGGQPTSTMPIPEARPDPLVQNLAKVPTITEPPAKLPYRIRPWASTRSDAVKAGGDPGGQSV